MSDIAKRDAYGQLMQLVRVLNDSLVTLCEAVIPVLGDLPEEPRAHVAGALTAYATQLRDQLTPGGDFKRLADTIERQANELDQARKRLETVRHTLRGAYTGISETSALRTQLVVVDEHLAAIGKNLEQFAPAALDTQ